MAKNKYSTEFKNKIIKLFNAGESQQSIAVRFNINKSVISRMISRYRTCGRTETFHRGGRPKQTTNRDDKAIVRLIKKDPFISAKDIKAQINLNIGIRTIQRRATESGLLCYRTAKKPFISSKNRLARLEFAREHLNWTISKWKSVLFSDESKFNFKGSDGYSRVRRPKGERCNPRYSKGTVKHGGGNIMVWGSFSGQGIGPIQKIDGIMDRFVYKNILENTMLPYAEEEMPLKWIFQQDNDPKHTSKVVKEWFGLKKIEVMKWPAQSPDLNPIENLWELVDRRIVRQDHVRQDTFFTQVKQAWESIPTNIIASMPRRCEAVLKNNGFATKY